MFTAPLVLIALLPWAGLVVWVMLGLNEQAGVPFLKLWDRRDAFSRPKRSVRRPPAGAVLMLVAALAGIVAAAGPARRGGRDVGTLDVVIDRGAGHAALDAAATLFARDFDGLTGNARVTFVPYQPSETVPLRQVARLARDVATTGADTAADLAQAVAAAARASGRTVVALTDRESKIDFTGVRVIAPPPRVGNVALTRAGVKDGRLLVRVENGSTLATGRLRITSGGTTIEEALTLPPAGSGADWIFTLATPGDWVEARLAVDDDDTRDNVAYAARTATWPSVEARTALPPEVMRMIQVYARRRPAGTVQRPVAVVAGMADAPGGEPAVILARPGAGAIDSRAALSIDPAVPIGRGVDWEAVAANQKVAAPPPPDWKPIVSLGGRTLVAARETPVRQVWIGFDVTAWATRADFVVFFAAAFDWAGEGGDAYGSTAAVQLEAGVWSRVAGDSPDDEASPGVYRARDAMLVALMPPGRHAAENKAAVLNVNAPDRAGETAGGQVAIPTPLGGYFAGVAWALLATGLVLLRAT